jgi:hypothetical protein
MENSGVVSRPPVLDKEKDELIFENAVKNDRSSCVEEGDENDDDDDNDNDEDAEGNADDGEDENDSDSADEKTVIPRALKKKTN